MKASDFLSERMIFGIMIIVGYFGLSTLSSFFAMTPDQRAVIHDAQLVVGPILGMIAQAIWKTDKTDRQVADTAAVLAAKAPDLSSTGREARQ